MDENFAKERHPQAKKAGFSEVLAIGYKATFECDQCGAVITDWRKHAKWHENLREEIGGPANFRKKV